MYLFRNHIKNDEKPLVLEGYEKGGGFWNLPDPFNNLYLNQANESIA